MLLACSFSALLVTFTVATTANIDLNARQTDPCALIAPKLPYVLPSEALACMRSFAFNETLRQNVLANANGVLNLFTFEPYYLHSPPRFQESTVDIRGELRRMSKKSYRTDYDFSVDLYNVTALLNDGHTRWYPICYIGWQNLMPAPIVSLLTDGTENIYIVPDLVELVTLIGPSYLARLDTLKIDWKRLAGAKVLEINGKPAYKYVDYIAKVASGNYLDHGIRINSVYSSYRIVGDSWSQRFGSLANPSLPTLDGLTFKLIIAGSKKPETIFVPYIASFNGRSFTDSASYWEANCAATNATNGQDLLGAGLTGTRRTRPQPLGNIIDHSAVKAVGLPPQYEPTQTPVAAGNGLLFYTLPVPHNTTGVMFVGSFYPADYYGFQAKALEGLQALKAAGVTKLIIDVHNNDGGYRLQLDYALDSSRRRGGQAHHRAGRWFLYYAPNGYAFLNDTLQSNDFDYMEPSTVLNINGQVNKNSNKYHDTCQQYGFDDTLVLPEQPIFPLKDVVVVGNGDCASTCALFTTLLSEKSGVKEYVFGVRPGLTVEYKGMAGNQVMDWPVLATEFKTMKLQDHPLYPEDLLVDGDFRVNWRTAWSYRNGTKPIAYQSDPAIRVPYTHETYNRPQKLWEQVAAGFCRPVACRCSWNVYRARSLAISQSVQEMTQWIGKSSQTGQREL
ncbi:hypothetical protein BKA62DRAFT_807097 [Auriculariales sp. MPI-PUGE-AT-0066]|nr:hypothetical protein BKA62DRAFT_807097 [Auriculariales sp. MPI-PUGE-AT-0066]